MCAGEYKRERSLSWHRISWVISFCLSCFKFQEIQDERGGQVFFCPEQTWTWWQPWGQQTSREQGWLANILSASPLPAQPPALNPQPRAVVRRSIASSIMKPYKPVICCFMACFMKVSWQAALRMVPVTLTDGITKRKGALGREGRLGQRMGWGLYVNPARPLMGRGLAAGYHWYILRLPPFVRPTLLMFDLSSYSHLLFTNQLPHWSINQTGWWPVKGPVGMCEELWDRP